MVEFTFRARRSELREARTLVSDTLREEGIDSHHATTVVLVVNELIAAARASSPEFDAGLAECRHEPLSVIEVGFAYYQIEGVVA